MPTAAAITAAAARNFRFMVRAPPQTFTKLVTSCLIGYAETHTVLPLRMMTNGRPEPQLSGQFAQGEYADPRANRTEANRPRSAGAQPDMPASA
jgi:hypothetical protein